MAEEFEKVVRLFRRDEREPPPSDWHAVLRRTSNNREYLGDAQNIALAFQWAPELDRLLRFNTLALRVEFTRAPPWRTLTASPWWGDADDTDATCWLQREAIPARQETVARVVAAVASRTPFHPVQAFLRSLAWDGEPRIVEVLIEVLQARGPREYLGPVLRRFMIGAVARAMEPGCKLDTMLVLAGAQGVGKSTFVRALAMDQWAAEVHSVFGSKDAAQELAGAWFIEVPELASMKKNEIETHKAFLSRQVDHYRPSYGRAVIDCPRSCVFVGTTNQREFLKDPTGNRRFLPIDCAGPADLKLLRAQRSQLWAEAFVAYSNGEAWHLSEIEEGAAAAEQESHREVNELEADIGEYLEEVLADPSRPRVANHVPPGDKYDKRVTVREVYEHVCLNDKDRQSLVMRRALEGQIASSLRSLGWTHAGRFGRGRQRRTYYAPPPPPSEADGEPTYQRAN